MSPAEAATDDTRRHYTEAGIERELAERAKKDLATFVRLAWPLVEPETRLEWNWHLDEICDVLERVTAGELRRVIINVPPGTMKSLLVSVFWPTWEWASSPGLRYLTAAYGESLTVRDNERVRDIVRSPWFTRNFGLELKRSQNEKLRFDTTAGGWRIATSVGGRGTGEHPDRIIIDDPLTAEHARSTAHRDRAIQWFRRTVSTRGVTRGQRIVLIMQRLHEDDLAGHLLDSGGWYHVCFPMRYAPDAKPPAPAPSDRDHRREAGELLWPALFTEAIVEQLEIDLGPFGAAGQLQQTPVPEGGGLFKREWFDIVDELPAEGLDKCRGWDTAGTDNAGDYTAGVKIAREYDVGVFYIDDVLREQLGPNAAETVIKQTVEMDGPECSQREETEPGASGKTVIAARARQLAGYDYAGVPTSGDKVTRARAFRAQCQARNVRLIRAPWNKAYLDELAVFPMGNNDDQVDASAAAFNELTTGAGRARERDVELG